MRYKVLKRPGAGLARILGMRYGLQLWSIQKSRKAAPCRICDDTIEAGGWSYRPLTNGNNRMDRICVKCVDTVSITG